MGTSFADGVNCCISRCLPIKVATTCNSHHTCWEVKLTHIISTFHYISLRYDLNWLDLSWRILICSEWLHQVSAWCVFHRFPMRFPMRFPRWNAGPGESRWGWLQALCGKPPTSWPPQRVGAFPVHLSSYNVLHQCFTQCFTMMFTGSWINMNYIWINMNLLDAYDTMYAYIYMYIYVYIYTNDLVDVPFCAQKWFTCKWKDSNVV